MYAHSNVLFYIKVLIKITVMNANIINMFNTKQSYI